MLGFGYVQAYTSEFKYINDYTIEYTFTTNTHYQNFKKAKAWWHANKSLLTLHIENAAFGDNNLAVNGTYDAPTTLIDTTGIIYQGEGPRTASSMTEIVQFMYCTVVI